MCREPVARARQHMQQHMNQAIDMIEDKIGNERQLVNMVRPESVS